MTSTTPSSAHDSQPQDAKPSYRAPIPPVEERAQQEGRHEPRYVKSEPLRSPAFGQPGTSGPGASWPPASGVFPQLQFGLAPGMRLPRKSLAMAGLLALLFGPLGMLYSSVFGAFLWVGFMFWSALLAPPIVPFVWLFGVVWAITAAHRRNQRMAMLEQHFAR